MQEVGRLDPDRLMAIFNMTEEEMVEQMQKMLEVATHIVFLIGEIEAEADPEVVNLYIDLLGYAKRECDRLIQYHDPRSIREAIRQGSGDYARIQQKCINMGLV